jgi:hypothetical protein
VGRRARTALPDAAELRSHRATCLSCRFNPFSSESAAGLGPPARPARMAASLRAPLSRSLRRRVPEGELAKGELGQRLGHAPTEEVARRLGVGLTRCREFLNRCWHAQVGSLEARLECDGGRRAAVEPHRGDKDLGRVGSGGDHLIFLRGPDVEGDRWGSQPHRGRHLADTTPRACQAARDAH